MSCAHEAKVTSSRNERLTRGDHDLPILRVKFMARPGSRIVGVDLPEDLKEHLERELVKLTQDRLNPEGSQ